MTKGIHHITAIASDAAETVHFYATVLGLRLVKKTVNQDDTETYHLFFGDKVGHPGMDLTFFIFQPAMPGKVGNGLVSTISLAVPLGALPFWEKRFVSEKVPHEKIVERFGHQRLAFVDKDNQQLELVETEFSVEESNDVWVTKDINDKVAIRNFYSATLSVISVDSIEPVLSHVFGYREITSVGHLHLYESSGSNRAHLIEVNEQPSVAPGINAAGTVHHIAFRAKHLAEQAKMREHVLQLGLYPTEVIDRFYFKSVYFRTPAGILFEIATDGPGFTADEKEEELGKNLALPPFLLSQRKEIESHLPIIKIED